MRKPIAIATLLVVSLISDLARADLMEQYLQSDRTPTRSQLSYSLGPNISPLAGERKSVDLSAGIKSKGSCGNLKFDGAAITSAFKEFPSTIQSYVTNLVSGVVQSAPQLLVCYANQTMCDIYKHFEALAQAQFQLRQQQCQQIEQMAGELGTSLRNNRTMECISEEQSQGTDYYSAIKKCGEVSGSDSRIPGTNQYAANYNLSDVVGNLSSNPDVQTYVNSLLGDVQFSASSGINTLRTPKLGQEYMVADLTEKYYAAFQTAGENAINSGKMPSSSELKTLSTPGFPITPLLLTKLKGFDPATRETFYGQYATVAAMTVMLYRIEESVDALEIAKNASQDKDSIAKIENSILQLQRKYDLMERRMAFQKDYLMPMFTSLMSSSPPSQAAPIPEYERRYDLPKSIIR